MKNRWAFAGRRGVAGLLAVLLLLGAVGCHNDPPIEGESSAQTDVTDPSGIDSTTDPNGTTGTDVTTGDGTDVTTGDNGTSRPNTDKTTGNNTTTVPTTTPPLSGDFSIVKDGAATSTIVISTNAGDDVRAAAEDLQACIRKMTGATVPIGFDSVDRTNGNFILVGPSKYTDQLGIRQPTGFPDNEQVILKRSGNYLVLMGNDDQSFVGTQNAVTMFLEMQGCGWFGPDELWQVYPSTQNISVGSLDIVHKPKFTVRHNRVDAVKGVGNRWYLNGPESLTGHYLPTIIPKDTYFRTHPEWFSEIDGVRTVSATWWQYCYSNQEFAQEVAKPSTTIRIGSRFPLPRMMAGTTIGANARNAPNSPLIRMWCWSLPTASRGRWAKNIRIRKSPSSAITPPGLPPRPLRPSRTWKSCSAGRPA